MSEWITLGLAFVAGMLLSLFYFGGLWLTVNRLASARQPALLALGSSIIRIAVLLTAFYFVMGGRIDRLLVCLAGFMLARLALLRWLGPGNAASSS